MGDLKSIIDQLKLTKFRLDVLEKEYFEKDEINRARIREGKFKLREKQNDKSTKKLIEEIKRLEAIVKENRKTGVSITRIKSGQKSQKKKSYKISVSTKQAVKESELQTQLALKKSQLQRIYSEYDLKLIKLHQNSKKILFQRTSQALEVLGSSIEAFEESCDKPYAMSQISKIIKNYDEILDVYSHKIEQLKKAKLEEEKARRKDNLEREKALIGKFKIELKQNWVRLNSFKTFIHEAKTYGRLFDNLFNYPLTDSQRKSILSEAERNLVVASAGSGKTSTLMGKFAYLVESKKASEEEILIIAFNKAVQIEIERRLNKLGYENVKVKTFHGLGNEILKSANFINSIDDSFGTNVWRTIQNLDKLILPLENAESDYKFKFLDFAATCPRHSVEPFVENLEEYNEAISKYPFRRHKARIGFKPFHIPSLDGKSWVRSQQELFIANSLYINGINFEYEAPLEKKDGQKIHPDFYFPELNCYYEHYAVFDEGDSPYGKNYEASHKIKEEYYRKNNIDCFSTNLSDYQNGTLEKKLYLELRNRGIHSKPLPNNEIDKKIKELYFDNVKELLARLIVLAKESNLNDEDLIKRIDRLEDQTRAQKFKEIFIPLYKAYKSHLKLNKKIDFSDLINEANQILKAKDKKTLQMFNFKYILVDEFQDISKNREMLIKNLLEINQDSKLFAVGDDWQSIYRFTGSDIGLMTDFEDRFHPKHTQENIISETHRFPKEISDLASEFISKNPWQIEKSITTSKGLGKIALCKIEKYSIEDIKRILDRIPVKEGPNKQGVFIIYRNENSVLDITDAKRFQNLQEYREDLDLTLSSIHGVKGLENDIVIVLGLDGGMFGFPRLSSEDPIISMLLPEEEDFPNAEERRVMYVALTRAKERIFITSAPGNHPIFFDGPSEFFLELEDIATKQLADNEASLEILNFLESIPCPRCKEKKLNQKMRIKSVRKTEENIESGLFPSIFMGCSGFTTNIESPMFCDYTSNVVDCPNCLLDGNKSFLECEVIMESQETKYIVKCNKCSYREDYFYFQKKDETTK